MVSPTLEPTPEPSRAEPAERPDLRMPLLGGVGWLTGIAAIELPASHAVAVVAALAALVSLLGILRRWGSEAWLTLVAGIVVAAAVLVAALVGRAATTSGPVADLARDGAAIQVTGRVVSDPRPVAGGFADLVAVRVQVEQITGRGVTHRLGTPVLVLGSPAWSRVGVGAQVSSHGRLTPSDNDDVAAVLVGAADPRLRSPPGPWWRGAETVRDSLRRAVAHRSADQRVLVPALVDGDDAGLDPTLEADFKTTGLTHLTAVSGTNLTLIVGFLLVLARWVGVRGRWLTVVAMLGIGGFVLLARTEPSVLRAAVMGGVGLVALGTNGARHGLRALGVAVVLLVLVQPRLCVSAGFALSVLATAGIVVLAPGWASVLGRWLPGWLAAALAVPLAAQVACTPVIAALSGQVSLVAVAANLLAEPAVAPATVLGLVAGLVGLVSSFLASLLGTLASWCVAWIVVVARTGSDLPAPALSWGTGPLALAALVAGCLLLVLVLPALLRRPVLTVCLTVLGVVVTTVRLPAPGWPGDDWVLAVCDVGQGDALVLRAGPGSGVVVDAGPDPRLVDRCLDRLHIDRVPLVVLTHFHADHVAGLPGVLGGRSVGQIWTTSLLDPPEAVADVRREAASAGVPVGVAEPGAPVTVGDVTLQQVWPLPAPPHDGPGDGSTANDASVVLLAQVHGVSLVLTGDVEPAGQSVLARTLAGLDVDVLKVPHHGSRYQDLDWLTSLRSEIAVVSVGADNDYGHPAAGTLAALESGGAEVGRTDQDGDLLVETDGTELTLRGDRHH